jgi:hypothetical protein
MTGPLALCLSTSLPCFIMGPSLPHLHNDFSLTVVSVVDFINYHMHGGFLIFIHFSLFFLSYALLIYGKKGLETAKGLNCRVRCLKTWSEWTVDVKLDDICDDRTLSIYIFFSMDTMFVLFLIFIFYFSFSTHFVISFS